ncbi:MAG: putative molybdenum carrier protein [Rhodothermus sp.]|nr:putative molybdenum carrier protein [Rhodothermus sp.]
MESWKLERVVSGGQTGVDRAALDAARASGVPIGGWCPRGRWAEDGPIPDSYPLQETPSPDPIVRTQWNVRDSDGTLILHLSSPLRGGTAQTEQVARQLGKPCLVLNLERPVAELVEQIRCWLAAEKIRVLNVAGPRESQEPGIYHRAYAVLAVLFRSLGARAER